MLLLFEYNLVFLNWLKIISTMKKCNKSTCKIALLRSLQTSRNNIINSLCSIFASTRPLAYQASQKNDQHATLKVKAKE